MRVLESIRRVPEESWLPIATAKMIAFSIGLSLFILALFKDKDRFIFIIDHANLAFHEAGHLFFALFGETSGLYGGTLGQLLFPFTVVVAFWLRREAISFAVAVVWFFENFLNISLYMADARARVLPLVGGGEHDWGNIFNRWGLLAQDSKIATVFETLGWMGLLVIWIWVVWRWYEDREQTSELRQQN